LVYPFTAAVVVFVRWCWRNSVRTRPLVVLSLAGMFVIQLGGVVYRIRRDPYHREYLPAADFLRARAQPGDLIMGSHELRFTLGFRDDFVDDRLLGLKTGKRAGFIFVEEIYQGRFDTVLLKNPAQFARLQERLAQYRVIYNEKNYRVLALRPEFKAGAVRPRHTLWRAPADLLDTAQFAQASSSGRIRTANRSRHSLHAVCLASWYWCGDNPLTRPCPLIILILPHEGDHPGGGAGDPLAPHHIHDPQVSGTD
jgi:hypothetical protein